MIGTREECVVDRAVSGEVREAAATYGAITKE